MDLKSGVKSSAPMPVANTSLPLGASCISTDAGSALTLPPPEASSPAPAAAAAVSSFTLPWASSANLVMRKMGTASDTMDGTMSHLIVSMLLMLPLIQSMVVVTSPMGVQAPPALAARTTAAPKNWRRSGSLTSLRRSETMTMVLVRLSRMARRRLDDLGHELEPLVRVHDFHDGHRTEKEEYDLAHVRDVAVQVGQHQGRVAVAEHADGPQGDGQHEGHARLVEGELLLEDDAEVAQDEDGRERELLVLDDPAAAEDGDEHGHESADADGHADVLLGRLLVHDHVLLEGADVHAQVPRHRGQLGVLHLRLVAVVHRGVGVHPVPLVIVQAHRRRHRLLRLIQGLQRGRQALAVSFRVLPPVLLLALLLLVDASAPVRHSARDQAPRKRPCGPIRPESTIGMGMGTPNPLCQALPIAHSPSVAKGARSDMIAP